MDGWPRRPDGGSQAEMSSPERGSRTRKRDRDSHADARRPTGETEGGGRYDARMALRSTALCGVGGVLLLTSAFMDGLHDLVPTRASVLWLWYQNSA